MGLRLSLYCNANANELLNCLAITLSPELLKKKR